MSAPHLLHIFSTFVPAGPETRTVRLINALGTELRHSILAIDGRTAARELLDPEVDTRILEAPPKASTPRTFRALRAVMKAEQPDLVLSYNWGAFDSVFATRSLGLARRHLHHEDGFNADEADGFKGRREWTRRLFLPGVGRVIVPSHYLQGVATRRWRLREEHVRLVPNGTDLSRFSPGAPGEDRRRELGVDTETPVVGFVGHLRPVKNPVRLVRAFAAVRAERPPVLLVLGEGPERAAMLAEAERLGCADRVRLVGHQSDPAPWFAAMDIFAMSSDSEQMPVALVEAMGCALPVASTDTGDVAHMLPEEQQPFVVEHEDAALTTALETLVASPDLRARLGSLNRARAEERYTFESMLAAYRGLYLETLAR